MAKSRLIDHHPEPHSHHEHPDPHLRPKAIARLKMSFFIGLGLFLAELIGAWASQSLALLADSFHVLADLFGVGITLFATRLAERPHSSKRSYGYYRVEVLAALFNGLLLAGLALTIFKSAYHRISMPHTVDGPLMLGVAVIGFAVNLIMLFTLKPAHQHNLNLRSAYLHVLGDTISSVGVIIGAIIIVFTGLTWVDAVTGGVVGTLLLIMSLRLIWDSIHVLLEGTPKHMDPDEIENKLRAAFPQIVNVHDFHVWEITAHLFAMTAHVEAKIQTLEEARSLIDEMNALIKANYGIGHTTFQVEPLK